MEQKRRVGCFCVMVDSKTEVLEFCQKLGFVALEPQKRSKTVLMFLAVKVIERALGS